MAGLPVTLFSFFTPLFSFLSFFLMDLSFLFFLFELNYMKHNYIFNSIDTTNFKGDKPLTKLPKIKKKKVKLPSKPKVRYIIKSRIKKLRIWDNF